MQSIKEPITSVAASARSGLEKTKAVLQEKADKMSAQNATETEEESVHGAELDKQDAGGRHSGDGTYSYSTTGDKGRSMGQVTEGGTVKSHPIGTTTAPGRPTTAHNMHVGAATNKGYGTECEFSG